ncbi:MAG: phosphotransferase [Acidimicrobiales bacterium]|nr:phosphotransferase [Acidimicrobiales bacterium]
MSGQPRPSDAGGADRSAGAAASAALDLAGASGDDVVVRAGASLLVRRGNIVARVRPSSDRPVSERELTLAHRLVGDGVPTVLPDDRVGMFEHDGHVATCWTWVDSTRAPGPTDLGELANLLRERTSGRGPDGVTPFDPIGHILEVVGDCGDDPDVCFVRERAESLRAPFRDAVVSDPLGWCVVHGDLHADNVVVGVDGPLLLDLELGGWGPASYDAAPAVAAVRRYGAPGEHAERFFEASGADPRPWPGFETLLAVYELWVTAWAVSVAHRRQDWAAEAAQRVETLRDGVERRWRLS